MDFLDRKKKQRKSKRLNQGTVRMGFGVSERTGYEERSFLEEVSSVDLIEYGIKPELVGKNPYIRSPTYIR